MAACPCWNTNDGQGLDADGAARLARKITQLIATGALDRYSRAIDPRDSLTDEELRERSLAGVCDGITDTEQLALLRSLFAPTDEALRERGRLRDTVRSFHRFLVACGGFEIW
jgi:hypothetical protein